MPRLPALRWFDSRQPLLTVDHPTPNQHFAGWIDVRAEGPGLLVVTDAWDPGWRARLDDAPARVVRVDHGEMAVVMPEGRHRVTFAYHPRGLGAGIALAAVGAAALGLLARRSRARVGV